MILTNYSLDYVDPPLNSYFEADSNQPSYSLDYVAPNSYLERVDKPFCSLDYGSPNSSFGADTNQLFYSLG